MIRSKFKVDPKPKFDANTGGTVTLRAVISQDPNHENKVFTDMTPWGEIKIGIARESTFNLYEDGAEYYVDFTKAE